MKSKEIIKVNNPVMMTRSDMEKLYDGYHVLITNMEDNTSWYLKGIVRYYGKDALNELVAKAVSIDNEDYGVCGVHYIGTVMYDKISLYYKRQ